jgi:hypothetical protein
VPKRIADTEFTALIARVQGLGGNVAVDGLLAAMQAAGAAATRRTLQRHLARLVAEGRLVRAGRGPASRYHAPAVASVAPPPARGWMVSSAEYPARYSFSEELHEGGDYVAEPASVARPAVGLPVSSEAALIRRAVLAPQHLRRPVGYQRAWLEAYRPNETYYLPSALRTRLAELGRAATAVALPAGTHARQVLDRLLIDLAWNSSRLEGNTYSLLETERLLALGESADGKDAGESRMILNHKTAIELLVDQADEIGFNRYTVLNLHAILAEGLLRDDRACGRLRVIPVGMGGSVFHPLAEPSLIEECFARVLASAAAIRDPFEQAFFAMVHLPYLQPFEDVNKRVSRLAANIPFIRQNFSPLSFVDVPQQDYVAGMLGVYELNRVELLRDVFAWAYERSCARYAAVRQSLGAPDPFRLRHRELIARVVGEVVRGALGRAAALAHVRREVVAAGLPAADQQRLTHEIETSILDLHEGNFARYRVRPSEYHRWRAIWVG